MLFEPLLVSHLTVPFRVYRYFTFLSINNIQHRISVLLYWISSLFIYLISKYVVGTYLEYLYCISFVWCLFLYMSYQVNVFQVFHVVRFPISTLYVCRHHCCLLYSSRNKSFHQGRLPTSHPPLTLVPSNHYKTKNSPRYPSTQELSTNHKCE